MSNPIPEFMKAQVQALTTALGRRHAKRLLTLLAIDMSKINDSEPMQRRLIDTVDVVGRAMNVMRSDTVFDWLTQPEALLGNRVPLNVLRSSNGLKVIEDTLGAIYAGVLA